MLQSRKIAVEEEDPAVAAMAAIDCHVIRGLCSSFLLMKSFVKYVTPRRIISLVAKERAKCAKNCTLGNGERRGIQKEISDITPSRNMWVSLPSRQRARIENSDARNVQAIEKTIKIHYHLHKTDSVLPGMEYVRRLQEFIQDLIATVKEGKYDFSDGIGVVAKFKEDDGQGNAIYRPLCLYSSLKTKILIALASKYLTTVLDPFLHTEILAYRARRQYHGEYKVTDGSDAVFRVKEFLATCAEKEDVYVAECDIQKFFDIINHRVVLECFDSIAERANVPDYHSSIRKVLEAYLASYSFAKNIMSLNEDEEFWQRAKSLHKGPIKGRCLFKWVDEAVLEEYYGGEDYREEREHLGVPQGGALSCIIANVVLDSVDRAAGLDISDPDKLFVRYGDDILLMHKNEEECSRLIEAYALQLRKHKLVSHKFNEISQFKTGDKLCAGYWNVKSKSTFKLGKGEGNAAEWIGFVGYEINRRGETRLRRSTLDKRFGDINKRYHSCKLDNPRNVDSYMKHNRRKVAGMPSSLKKFPALDFNGHSEYQMKSLDRYRWVKVKRLQEYFNNHPCSSVREYEQANPVKSFLENSDYSFYRRLKDKYII